MDSREKTYNDIISFYDFAEELIDTVEDKKVVDPIAQLEYVEPIIEQIEHATDTLAEEYRTFVKTGKPPGFLTRRKISKSIKNIYDALIACQPNNTNK